jgi:Flp pilus assembly protein TadG
MRALLQRLKAERTGTMAIETAIVAPVLLIMALGVFEVGSVVARQHELQSTANEAAMIVLAANRGPQVELSEMATIIKTSVSLQDSQINLTREYRCNMANGRVKNQGNCPADATISSYIVVSVNDTYTPTWTAFGVGKPLELDVNRTVQVS